MRIFVTGATGFIGSHVIPELLAAGHDVVGATRSEKGAQALERQGVKPHRGTLEDPASLRAGAENADAVIHLAFDHDFSNFLANCEKDQRVIRAIGEALKGSDRPFLFTSGVGIGSRGPGQPAVENVLDLTHPNPRTQSEVLGQKLVEDGVKVIVMRLPQVHDTVKQGLISPYAMISRQKGVAAYIGDGANVWSAAHVSDVARLYKLAVEQGRAGERFNAVDEVGVPAREIAEVVGAGLGVPVKSLEPEEADAHFGWFARFAAFDLPASSEWTRERLGWTPNGPGLIEDLRKMDYSVFAA